MSESARWAGRARLQPILSSCVRRVSHRIEGVRTRANGRALLLYMSMPAFSGVNALIGLVLPALLGPTVFGRYSLAVTLFQYGLIFDFGTSQVIDRRAPVLAATEPARLDAFLAEALGTRLYIAGAVLSVGASLLVFLSVSQRLPFSLLDGILSMSAGVLFMLALGPMSVWRALSQRQDFTRWNSICACALAVARPLGIILGGMTGCLGALMASYGVIAVYLLKGVPPQRRRLPGLAQVSGLVMQGLPLFVTSMIWAVYMTASRWVVSFVALPLELGHFAFGANVLSLIVGTIAALSQLYYPMIIARHAGGAGYRVSGTLARDLCGLAGAATLLAAAGMLAGPWLIEHAYQSFVGSQGPMRILLTALPSLVVSSWLMPVALATTSRPWAESALTYPASLLLLVGATWEGARLFGLEGAAWGTCVSAPCLVALQLGTLRLNHVLSGRHSGLILLATATATALLALLTAA